MQPPSRVVCNSCHVFSHTTDREPWCNLTNPETTLLMLQLVQVILLACLVVSLLSLVQPNQANKRVNFQLAISSYLPISGHQGRIGAHDLQQCCFFTSPFLMAGRSAWMRVIRSEWSKNDIKYNCTSIFNINWTLCLHHGWSEVECVDANFGQHTRALERAYRKQIEKLRGRADRSDQLSKPVRPVPYGFAGIGRLKG